jgi:hypothetical protein
MKELALFDFLKFLVYDYTLKKPGILIFGDYSYELKNHPSYL